MDTVDYSLYFMTPLQVNVHYFNIVLPELLKAFKRISIIYGLLILIILINTIK